MRTTTDIMGEINRACAERLEEFGEAHAIRQWVLSPKEWEALADEARGQLLFDVEDWHPEDLTVHTQYGRVKIYKGI